MVEGSKQQALQDIVIAFQNAVAEIAEYLRQGAGFEIQETGTKNLSGDKQLKADIVCDQIVFRHLQGKCKFALSEETSTPQNMNGSHFTVTFDPLDGSSIIDVNFSIGTIFGIWDADDLLNQHVRETLIYSGVVMYGSRTTMILENKQDLLAKTTENATVDEYTLIKGNWVRTKENLRIKETTKMFSPANLRAVGQHQGYKSVVSYWEDKGYTLRYTGGMVPDVYQIFIKGGGVFSNPITSESPPKLRVLFEAAPICRIAEVAGGASYSKDGKSMLDLVINDYNMKTQMCVGSKVEVNRFKEACP